MCGCLKAEHQAAVATGGHHAVQHVPAPAPVFVLPDNFDDETVTAATAPRMILDDVNERTVSVLTSLNPDETDFTPLDEKHSHQCYFGPTTWIIADVFKPSGGYGLNQAVLRQLHHARTDNPQAIGPTNAPALIIIKHCINPATAAYLKRVVPGSSMALETTDTAGFLNTVFGKSIARIVPTLGAGDGAVQDVRYRSQTEDIFIRIRYG